MNDTPSCAATEAHLPLFVGGDLEPGAREQVEAHLAGCAACRRALAGLARARAAVLELPARSPAPQVDLWPDLRGALVAEGLLRGASSPRAGGARRPRRLVQVLVPLAAAAGLALSLTLLRPDGEPAGSPEATVQSTPAPASLAGATPILPAVPVVPAATGGLRRLQPGDERLGATARPFPTGGGMLHAHPSGIQRPTLAGGLR